MAELRPHDRQATTAQSSPAQMRSGAGRLSSETKGSNTLYMQCAGKYCPADDCDGDNNRPCSAFNGQVAASDSMNANNGTWETTALARALLSHQKSTGRGKASAEVRRTQSAQASWVGSRRGRCHGSGKGAAHVQLCSPSVGHRCFKCVRLEVPRTAQVQYVVGCFGFAMPIAEPLAAGRARILGLAQRHPVHPERFARGRHRAAVGCGDLGGGHACRKPQPDRRCGFAKPGLVRELGPLV